jgi:hypothetical protein
LRTRPGTPEVWDLRRLRVQPARPFIIIKARPHQLRA